MACWHKINCGMVGWYGIIEAILTSTTDISLHNQLPLFNEVSLLCLVSMEGKNNISRKYNEIIQ